MRVTGACNGTSAPGVMARRPELTAYVHDCLRSAEPRALVNAVRSISLGRPDLTPLLSRVRARTVFVTGADDELWTAKDRGSPVE